MNARRKFFATLAAATAALTLLGDSATAQTKLDRGACESPILKERNGRLRSMAMEKCREQRKEQMREQMREQSKEQMRDSIKAKNGQKKSKGAMKNQING